MEVKKSAFVHIMDLAILIAATTAVGYFLYAEMKSIEIRLDQRMISQEKRIDQLYTMFVDLVKEGKK